MKAARYMHRGHSNAAEARLAVAELHAQVAQPELALVLFFCSSNYDLDALADEMNCRFAGVPVIGCTSAGEIGPAGYLNHSLVGVSFSAQAFAAETGRIDALNAFDIAAGRAFAEGLHNRLEAHLRGGNAFGLLLIDGLSLREEPVAHALQDGLGAVPMFGGSAGDDLKFQRTWVFHEGRFHTDSAVLLLMSTSLPFRILRSQHFVADSERLVVTEVDAPRRIVREINGRPAVQEYARLIGVAPEQLTPDHFASRPVVVMIEGDEFVRSIQHANPDGSLSFYCAIDEGVVLRVAHGVDLLTRMETEFAEAERELGSIEGMLVCDCVLRNLEMSRNGRKAAAGELFQRFHALGFSTYGEQIGGVHINQTLTGIAIGSAGAGHD
jgi:hypothetical protein